jgi:hypothetical protein
MFSEDKSQARKLYRAYIDDGIDVKKEDIYKTVSQRIRWEEKFVDTVMEKVDERFENKRKHHEYSLKKIVETIGNMKKGSKKATAFSALLSKSRYMNTYDAVILKRDLPGCDALIVSMSTCYHSAARAAGFVHPAMPKRSFIFANC